MSTMACCAIAAVNLHIASKAIVFMGVESSMWNYVQLPLLGAGDKPSRTDVKCSDSFWKITVATRAALHPPQSVRCMQRSVARKEQNLVSEHEDAPCIKR